MHNRTAVTRIKQGSQRNVLLTFLAVAMLTACGGGGSDVSPSPAPAPAPAAPAPTPAPANASLDFSIQGLNAGQSVTIRSVTSNPSALLDSESNQAVYNRNIPLGTLVRSYAVGRTYAFTIVTQPATQVCSVNTPTSTLTTDTQVIVSCA